MQIKTKPADFIVEEIADLPLKKTGIYAVYLLKKQGWNTAELLSRISRQLDIPFQDIAYGGRKDRHGLTCQYVTIKGLPQRGLKEKNYALQLVGLMDRPMGPDLIKGNKFEITVRKLEDEAIAQVSQAAGFVKLYGYPNYFDDQRFGNFDRGRGFLAEKILKKQYNGALKIYLTAVRPVRGKRKGRGKDISLKIGGTGRSVSLRQKQNKKSQFLVFLSKTPEGFFLCCSAYRKKRWPFSFPLTSHISGMRFSEGL